MKRIILFICLFAFPLLAQDHTNETMSEVPELSDFHDVIYQIWHTGWAEKDIKLLVSLKQEVENGYKNIANAELPGILRDKKEKWNAGVKKMGEAVENYVKAADGNDSTGILNAAEKLHSNFEGLVRVIRPMVKEVDEFHQVLYMLYHYYTPEFDFDKIKESTASLTSCMEKLNAAELPARLKSKQDKFDAGRKELGTAVEKLNETVNKGNDKDAITSAVNSLHSKYQALEKVFD